MKIKYFVMLGFVILSFGFISANNITDCGTDFDCFIDASLNCSLAHVSHSSVFESSGIISTSTIYYEINGIQEDKCILYFVTEKQYVNYTDEFIEELLSSGLTEEAIEKGLNVTNRLINLTVVGLNGSCSFNMTDLTLLLNRWKQNNHSENDFEVAECWGEYFNPLHFPTETSTQITSLIPTITISAYPTEFEIAINSSKNITKYNWDFGDGKNTTTIINKATHTYNSTGQYNLKITITDLNQNEFSKTFNVTVSSPKQAINNTLKKKLDDLNNVKTQIKSFDLFSQTSLNSVLNINSLNSTLYEIQKDYTNASSETEYNKIFIELLETEVPKLITTSKIADSISFYSGENNIDLEILALITGEEYDFDDENKYLNAILAWNHKNIKMKISFKEISVTYQDLTKPVLNVFEIKITKNPDVDDFYFILYELEGLEFKDDLFNERGGYFYSDLSENETIVFSTTEDISFADLPIFISPEISKLSIAGYDPIIEDPVEEKKWGLFILTMSLLIIIGFVVYIILQEWYKRKYENYLFKNRNNLYNLFTYIENVKRKGSNNKEVVSKLKKAGWNSEQIKYVTKKHAGKRTGMLELPVEKFLNIFKKTSNKKIQ